MIFLNISNILSLQCLLMMNSLIKLYIKLIHELIDCSYFAIQDDVHHAE